MAKSRDRQHTGETPQEELDAVLEAYVTTDEGPSRESLRAWIQRFPQYTKELTELTAHWAFMQYLPVESDVENEDDSMLVLRGMSAVRELLFARREGHGDTIPKLEQPVEQRREQLKPAIPVEAHPTVVQSTEGAAASAAAPIRGLLLEGRRRGLGPDALAERANMRSVTLLSKLDRRVIRAETIPPDVSRWFATALDLEFMTILAYHAAVPQFTPGIQRHTSSSPILPERLESFAEAVRSDPELSEEDKRGLLALATSTSNTSDPA